MSTVATAPVARDGSNAIVVARQTIAHHSRSFALASRVLPPANRDATAVVYTWCRRADDAVDEVPRSAQPSALARLRAELAVVYSPALPADPVLAAFQEIVRERQIPLEYPNELLAGMEMDVANSSYATLSELYLYCYRVASTVGLMMSHVMGVADPAAMRNAAHLGIAMQLSNICRDVAEDWDRGRLYLPDDLLARHGVGNLRQALAAGRTFPDDARDGVAGAIAELLEIADGFYRSGDRGMIELPWRCAFAVRTARRVYSAIGGQVRRQDCDPTAGRAVVPGWKKALLVLWSAGSAVAELPRRGYRKARGRRHQIPPTTTVYPDGILPL